MSKPGIFFAVIKEIPERMICILNTIFDDRRLSLLTLIISRWWRLRPFPQRGLSIYHGAVPYSRWKGRLLRLEWGAHGGLLLGLSSGRKSHGPIVL